MTTAVIVQARMSSTRLPGKVLLPLGRGTVLEEVLWRCFLIPGVSAVVCATSTGADDDPIVAAAERAGAVPVRGPLEDVLGRYCKAAEMIGADVVMRVTADCPLLDPALCGELLELMHRSGADYVSNDQPPSFPHGLDCEAFKTALLYRCERQAVAVCDREHVTPWMRREPSVRRASLTRDTDALTDQRWTLDYPEDYAFLRALFEKLELRAELAPWQEVARIIESDPEISKLNLSRAIQRH